MNLDELKTAWKVYDRRLQATEEISQKVVISMIKTRSVSRLARLQQRYMGMIALFLFYLCCFIACLIGNPFDYVRPVEYVPLVLLNLCCVLLVVLLFRARLRLKKAELEGMNLQEALEQVIQIHVSYRQLLRYAIGLLQASCMMIILSFLPRRISEMGAWMAVMVTCFPLIVLSAYFYIMKKRGWKAEDIEKGFRADLAELKELSV